MDIVGTEESGIGNQFRFFRGRRELPIYHFKGEDRNWEKFPNVSALFAVLITKKYATLHELQTVYSYEDALDMYEIAYINSINEDKANERSR